MCPHSVESTKLSTLFTKVLRSHASVPSRAFKNALLTKSSTLPKELVQTHMQSVKRMKSKESQRVIADHFLPHQLKRGLCKFAAEVSDPCALSNRVSLQPPTNTFSLKFTYYPPLRFILHFHIFKFGSDKYNLSLKSKSLVCVWSILLFQTRSFNWNPLFFIFSQI